MPLYTYKNPKTGKEMELLSSYAERDNQVCEDTGVPLERVGVEALASTKVVPDYYGLVNNGQFHKTRKA